MLEFKTNGNQGQPQQSRSSVDLERQKLKLQQQQQEQRAKNHWGQEIKDSSVNTMLNLMFQHISDPQGKPNPMLDPTNRR